MAALPDEPGRLIWTFHRLYPFSCAAVTGLIPEEVIPFDVEGESETQEEAGPAQEPSVNRTPRKNRQSDPQADSGE